MNPFVSRAGRVVIGSLTPLFLFGCSTPNPTPAPVTPPVTATAPASASKTAVAPGLPPVPAAVTHPPLKASLGASPMPSVVRLSAFQISNPPSSVSLAWDLGTDPRIAGYKLYEGGASRAYTNLTDVGLTNYFTFTNFNRGDTLYFAVTAYDSIPLESDFSAECVYISKPGLLPPVGLSVKSFLSDNLQGPWLPFDPWPPVDFTNSTGSAFFKLVVSKP